MSPPLFWGIAPEEDGAGVVLGAGVVAGAAEVEGAGVAAPPLELLVLLLELPQPAAANMTIPATANVASLRDRMDDIRWFLSDDVMTLPQTPESVPNFPDAGYADSRTPGVRPHGPPVMEYYSAYLLDPDGHDVEVVQRPFQPR